MSNKSMLEIAEEYLIENGETTFNKLWTEVVSKLKNVWREQNNTANFSDFESVKRSEFYKLLTLDGKFLRLRNCKWVLVDNFSFDEANNLKEFYKETANSIDKEK